LHTLAFFIEVNFIFQIKILIRSNKGRDKNIEEI